MIAVPAPVRVSGRLPDALRGGTLYRNGPGRAGLVPPEHPLDRDGLVARIRFVDAHTATYQSRRVQTDDGTRAAGGCFGGSAHARPHNASNTGVVQWGSRLLTLYESGLPYELSMETLRTKGLSDLDGAFSPREAVCAHYRVDSELDRLVMMATDPVRGTVRFVEFDRNWRVAREARVGVGGCGRYAFVHDFSITPDDYVFVQNGVRINLASVIRGTS